MSFLFTNEEFAAYLQVDEASLPETTIELLRSLIVAEIDDITGDVTPTEIQGTRLKAVALEAVRRLYVNPTGVSSATIGSISHTWDTPAISGARLTPAEQAQVRDIMGGSTYRRSIPLRNELAIRTYPRLT